MFICELFENKTLDPNIYGEMLPIAKVKQIVINTVKQVDPQAKVTVKQSPEGYYICRSEGLRLDFGITADGGDINANIVNAYSSYKGSGVVTQIFGECFKAAEQLWGTPQKFAMSAHEDRGHGVWQHIAQKLGAEWEGSITEISDQRLQDYLSKKGPRVDRDLERMSWARERLNKSYEIYHADRPANGSAIVDRFDADTPALARQYYERFIHDYESDRDFDLRLRRATGIMEYAERPSELINKTADVDGIQVSINTNKTSASVYATSNGKRLGYAEFDRDSNTLVPYDLAVDDKYRGQGIAAVMYDYVKSLGFKIKASADQTDAGKYFWKKNRGSKRVWEAEQTPAQAFIQNIYSQYPEWPYGQADRVMVWGEGEDQEFAAFKLKPGLSPDIVEIDWLMAGPEQRKGIGSRAIQELQRQASEAGVKLSLYPWGKGRISQSSLSRLYKRHGFKPLAKGAKQMTWAPELKEITTVPTVTAKKAQHLDVMPNDGRPIPAGEEAENLGKRVGNLGSVEVWSYSQGPMRTFVVFDPVTRISQLAVTGSSYPGNPNSLIIKGVYSGPKNATRAANLYAWLITKQGLTLVSDIKQSAGGYKVWQDLERRFGRYINIHGFNTKTNEPVNVGTQDDTETHVGQEHLPGATRDVKDTARNIRLVASPK